MRERERERVESERERERERVESERERAALASREWLLVSLICSARLMALCMAAPRPWMYTSCALQRDC